MRIRGGGCAGLLALVLAGDAVGQDATRYRMRSAREVWAEQRAASRQLSLRRAGSASAVPTARQLLRERHRRSRELFENRRSATLPTAPPTPPPDVVRTLHPARPVTPRWIRWGLRLGR